MLSKKNRAGKRDVDLLFKRGKSIASPNLNFKFTLNHNSVSPRISFVAPKSVAKLAVNRNLLRRRGYDALKKHIYKFPASLFGVFVFKKYQDDISILENEIKNILNQIH